MNSITRDAVDMYSLYWASDLYLLLSAWNKVNPRRKLSWRHLALKHALLCRHKKPLTAFITRGIIKIPNCMESYISVEKEYIIWMN